MPGSVRLGRVFGISIGVHWTWLIIFLLLTFTLAFGFFPAQVPGLSPIIYLAMGAVAAVLLFVAVLVHEMAHSLVARAQGMPVNSITLFIFGGVSNIQERPKSPGAELLMAIAGPITSIVLGFIFLSLLPGPEAATTALGAILFYLGAVNIVLGVFNLIPGFPLDGGRVLRSIIWFLTNSRTTATKIAATIGIGVAWLFILGGLFLAIAGGNFIGGLWIAFIGWFLSQAAGARYQEAVQREEGTAGSAEPTMGPEEREEATDDDERRAA